MENYRTRLCRGGEAKIHIPRPVLHDQVEPPRNGFYIDARPAALVEPFGYGILDGMMGTHINVKASGYVPEGVVEDPVFVRLGVRSD